MTQTERFLRFAQRRNELDSQEAEVLVRIENGGLVLTRQWPAIPQIHTLRLSNPRQTKRNGLEP